MVAARRVAAENPRPRRLPQSRLKRGRKPRTALSLKGVTLPTGRKLLLADDSPTVQKVVSLTFGDEGMAVTTVGSGQEALAELGREVPDVVLADVHMPPPNGYELCALIKRDERTRGVPVMLLVGSFEPFDEAEARRVGADDVLTKPFQSIRELVNKVGGLLGGHQEEKPAVTHEGEATGELHHAAGERARRTKFRRRRR